MEQKPSTEVQQNQQEEEKKQVNESQQNSSEIINNYQDQKYYEYEVPVIQEQAEAQLEKIMAECDTIKKAVLHNKFGSFMYQGQSLEKAKTHFQKAIEMATKQYDIKFSNAFMNLANVCGTNKDFEKAISYYKNVIKCSPYNPKTTEKFRLFEYSARINSQNAYVDAHINLGVLLSNTGHPEEGFEFCEKALQLAPDNREALVNIGDIMRQIGRKNEAIKYTWQTIQNYIQKNVKGQEDFQIPQRVDIPKCNEILKKQLESQENKNQEEEIVNIVCVKYGTRYDSEYVNKLYRGIKNNTTKKFKFHCFTDNPEGLDSNIIPKELLSAWERWWGKCTLFGSNNGIKGSVFYIDLDMIITGNIDEILSYKSAFATLKTDYIECEQNHKDGYNSSVMIWDTQFLNPVYDTLKQNYDQITKYIVRFDFWLEMMIEQAEYLQEVFQGQISDYLSECKEKVPENTRIVCFPRKPKPEDYPSEWIKEIWL